MNSPQERDEWIEKIIEVIESTTASSSESGANENAQAAESEPASAAAAVTSQQSSKRPSITTPASSGGLVLLGVTVIKESKLARLQANQPTLLSQSSSDESILNEISLSGEMRTKEEASSRLISNVFPGKSKRGTLMNRIFTLYRYYHLIW